MKRILMLFVGLLFLFSCELTINEDISTQYLVDGMTNGDLDIYLQGTQIFRYKGKPGVETIPIGNENLSQYESCFVLHVATGTTTETIVSSAIIKLDGLEVLNTSDFSKNGGQHTFEVCDITQASSITVEVRGKPGSYIEIWIEGKKKELTVTDCDGNIYKTVKIGEQIWMAENLKTTKYNDCTPIPYVLDNTEWYNLTSPSYSFYDFDESNKDIYGALYNYHTVATNKLCPIGWHVPSYDDFKQLVDYLGGNEIAQAELKEGGSSGFNLVSGGLRDYPGNFGGVGETDFFWLSTYHWFVTINSKNPPHDIMWWYWQSPISNNRGFSVRCVIDN